MKVKLKKVYYCDYCKKHSLRSLESHEKHCTANLNRECRLCGRKDIINLIPKYKIDIDKNWFTERNTVLGETKAEIDKMMAKKIRQMKEDVDCCPNCVLTIIRCNKYRWPLEPDFDYKKELEEWWDRKNAEYPYERYC